MRLLHDYHISSTKRYLALTLSAANAKDLSWSPLSPGNCNNDGHLSKMFASKLHMANGGIGRKFA